MQPGQPFTPATYPEVIPPHNFGANRKESVDAFSFAILS